MNLDSATRTENAAFVEEGVWRGAQAPSLSLLRDHGNASYILYL